MPVVWDSVFQYGFRLLFSLKRRVVTRTIPVAMAPLAQSNADNIAAWTLRSTPLLVSGQGNNSSSEATVEKRGSGKISMHHSSIG